MNISPKAKETTDRLNNFMDKHVYPNNETYHSQIENFGADRWQAVSYTHLTLPTTPRV